MASGLSGLETSQERGPFPQEAHGAFRLIETLWVHATLGSQFPFIVEVTAPDSGSVSSQKH